MRIKSIILIVFTFTSCIGTDVIDDAIVPETLSIDESPIGLLAGETAQLSASYTDQFGIVGSSAVTWNSSDPSIASIDDTGLVTAHQKGQVTILAMAGDLITDPVCLGVVENADDVAKVRVSSESANITVGESVQLLASSLKINGEKVEGQTYSWAVDNESIATISDDGTLTGVSDGMVTVTAEAEGIKSTSFVVTIGGITVKTGVFTGASGYKAEGMVTLEIDDSDQVILTFDEGFDTSFALGTYVYLANSNNGQTVKSSGLDLGEITSGGAKTFNVTQADPDVTLETYRYVIILCKPAGITFGFADLNE